MSIDQEGSKKQKKAFGLAKALKKGSTKIIVTVVALGAIGVGSYFTAYNYNASVDASLQEIVSAKAETTILDELLATEEYAEASKTLANIESSTILVQELEDLNLDQYNEDLTAKEMNTELSVEDVKELMETFEKQKEKVDLKTPTKETKEFYETVATLTAQRDGLKEALETPSVASVNKYTEALIKAIVIDSLELSQDETANIVVLLNDKGALVTYTDPVSGKKYPMDVQTLFNNLKPLIDDVKELNAYNDGGKKDNDGSVVTLTDEELNKRIRDIMNRIKIVLEVGGYNIEDGTIKQDWTKNTISKVLFK